MVASISALVPVRCTLSRPRNGSDRMSFSDAKSATSEVLNPEIWRSWSEGPRWYFVLAAMITDYRVEAYRENIAADLGNALQLTSPGQPHVSVRALGFKSWDWEPRTVELEVHAADTFSSAVYLRVKSSDIVRLQSELETSTVAFPSEDRKVPYVPHVTVGTYLRRVPLLTVRRLLAETTPLEPIRLTAEVRQVAVDTRSQLGELRDP